MSVKSAQALIEQAQAFLAQAVRELGTVTPTGSAPIATMEDFDRALAAAVPGDVLTLSTTLDYRAPLVIRVPVVLRSEVPSDGRMTLDVPTPKFLYGIKVVADHVSLVGLEVRHPDRVATLVDIAGSSATIERCRVLGDPAFGQKRGIAINGAACTVTRCYVEDCFGPYPGDDCQAVYAQDTPGPVLIEDCYLSGSTETVMFGGGDPSSIDGIPSDITIRGNTITKRPEWQTQKIGVKNTLELKNAKRVRILDNLIEYSWGGKGQTGYLLMLTPRNQGGSAPYSTVEDVEVAGNTFRHGAAAFSLLGDDNNQPSQLLSRVNIHDNTFEDLDPVLYTGDKRMILVQRGPRDVSIVNNTFTGKNFTSWLYFAGARRAENLIVTGNKVPKARYSVFGDGAILGQAWAKYVSTGTCDGNIEG